MNSSEIRKRYLAFFEKRGHAVIPSASLVPENDPSVLFNTAGMQPLVPYLLGQKHPAGAHLVDAQKCIRTIDIEDVGDNRHLTFFEMLGNWSLGSYFKKEAIEWSYEFLTSKEEGLGLDPNRLYVTVFKGEEGIPRDEDSIKIWTDVFARNNVTNGLAGDDGIITKGVRIVPLGKDDNFWIAGTTGPCGGDTEMFYDTRPEDGNIEETNVPFEDLIKSFRIMEIWNNVFMEFNKNAEGKYEKLLSPNVDTGMGLERTTAVINGKTTVFDTDLFIPILLKISELIGDESESSQTPQAKDRAKRIVADHLRTSVFLIADGVLPSNTDQGYILRRLLRRAVRLSDVLKMKKSSLFWLADVVIDIYKDVYPELLRQKETIKVEIDKEEQKFRRTLVHGVKEFEQMVAVNKKNSIKIISGHQAFKLFSSYGFPIEITEELAKESDLTVNKAEFDHEMKEHQDLSRKGAEKKFKGGLSGTGVMETKYHTTTHLLNAALKSVLGNHVSQKGSNITSERLRFDFSHGDKMTDSQKKAVEDFVNEKIKESLDVTFSEMPKTEAQEMGAIGVFDDKYGDIVKVYQIGKDQTSNKIPVSMELCGGPHVNNTNELGHFKITKEEAVAQGVRRIKAILE